VKSGRHYSQNTPPLNTHLFEPRRLMLPISPCTLVRVHGTLLPSPLYAIMTCSHVSPTQWDTPDGSTKVELGHRNLEITTPRFILNSGTGCRIIANDVYVACIVLKVALTEDSLYVTIALSMVLKSAFSRTNYPTVCIPPTEQGILGGNAIHYHVKSGVLLQLSISSYKSDLRHPSISVT
jgi:hypothetical protein